MRALKLGAAIALLAGPALASDKSDINAVVSQFGHASSVGDMKAAAALCTADAVVIDDFPPHAWGGGRACAKWGAGLMAMMKSGGMSDAMVAVAAPTHLAVTGGAAYAVYPATFSFKLKGKAQVEKGLWTFAMRKGRGGWRISGWSWASE